MNRARLPATICVAACAVTIALVAIPYFLALPRTVGVYYQTAAVGPPLVALFVALAAIVVTAGYTGRTDPGTAAGIGVVLGLFAVGTAWWWASSVDPRAMASVSPIDLFRYHRWALALSATAVAVGAAWYARSTLGSS